MSSCLQCGEPTPPPKGRRKKSLMYCSKKCANKYLGKKHYTYVKKNPNWGSKTREKAERKAELDSCEADPNLFSMSDVAKLGNIEKSNVSARYKKLEITPARSITGNRLYFSKEQVDQILDYENQMYPMAAGCITTREVLELLDICGATFARRKSFIDLEPEGTTVRNGTVNDYYDKKKVIQFEIDWQQRQINRKEEISQRQKERLEQIQREQKEFEEWFAKETKGLLSSKEFAIACGTKVPSATVEPTIKVRGYGNYYHPDKVEEYKTFRDSFHPSSYVENPKFGRMPSGRLRRTPLRKDKWTDAKPYVERRLLLEARSYDTMTPHKQSLCDQFREDVDAWKANGYTNPRTKQCLICEAQKPFYDYYKGSSRCKSCRHPHKKEVNPRDPEHVRMRVGVAFAITIRQELSKGSKKYNKMPIPILWDEVEKHLGYNREDLLEHLESKFEPWMDWTCWGRTRKNKEGKCWEIDHIKPRSIYAYTDINTPEFKEVWSLDNVRPLSRKENIVKADKKTS